MSEPKRLHRDVEQGKVGGVAAGFADYLGVDVTLLRVVLVVMLIVTFGATLVVYVAAWLLIPPKPTAGAAIQPTPPHTP